MCVVAFAWKAHPDWPLVLVANRDEFHARAAAPLSQWTDQDIIAGRDLEAGGTWLGISGAGRIAVVTNLTGFGDPVAGRSSRGDLVVSALIDPGTPAPDFGSACNPFNLAVIDGNRATLLTNRPKLDAETLAPGIHGLSNGQIGQPWARQDHIVSHLQASISQAGPDTDALFDALADERPLGDLPGGRPVFIREPVYGTRCSTVVLIDRHGTGLIVERGFGTEGSLLGETRFNFKCPIG